MTIKNNELIIDRMLSLQKINNEIAILRDNVSKLSTDEKLGYFLALQDVLDILYDQIHA